jgi:Holliday junction resolvase RusA-like endonuclease
MSSWPDDNRLSERQRQKVEKARQKSEPVSLGVAEVLRTRRSQTFEFRITGRPYSTKNSRSLANGRSFMSKGATQWIANARKELRAQFSGDPLTGPYEVSVRAYYADGRHHLDLDNMCSAALDALKGLVLLDDSPRYICKLTASSQVSRVGEAYMEITLTEVV